MYRPTELHRTLVSLILGCLPKPSILSLLIAHNPAITQRQLLTTYTDWSCSITVRLWVWVCFQKQLPQSRVDWMTVTLTSRLSCSIKIVIKVVLKIVD